MLTIRKGYYIINLASRLEQVKNLENTQYTARKDILGSQVSG